MNLQVLLILLSFTSPKHQDMPLLEQPQVSAPLTLKEDREWRWIIRTLGMGQ